MKKYERINSLATLTWNNGRKVILNMKSRTIGFENMYD